MILEVFSNLNDSMMQHLPQLTRFNFFPIFSVLDLELSSQAL